jgi:hypothetical protein
MLAAPVAHVDGIAWAQGAMRDRLKQGLRDAGAAGSRFHHPVILWGFTRGGRGTM